MRTRLLNGREKHPQPYQRDAYQGDYQDPTGTPTSRM